MAKKVITVKDILTKTLNVYKKDIYIVHCKYLVAGKESDLECQGTFISILTPEASQVLMNEFDPEKTFYISDYGKYKDNAKDHGKEYSDYEIPNIINTVKYYEDNVFSHDEWDTFNFTEKDLEDLFNGTTIGLFTNNEKIPTTLLNKSMIPMITKKNIFKLVYFVQTLTDEEIGDFYAMHMNLITDYFQIFITYKFYQLIEMNDTISSN